METKIVTSGRFEVQWRDAIKGLVVAVITAVLSTIYGAIEQGGDLADINWTTILKIGVTAGIGYVLKNWLFEPAKVIVEAPTNTEAKEVTKTVKQALWDSK